MMMAWKSNFLLKAFTSMIDESNCFSMKRMIFFHFTSYEFSEWPWPIHDKFIKSPIVKGSLEFAGSNAGPRTPKEQSFWNKNV